MHIFLKPNFYTLENRHNRQFLRKIGNLVTGDRRFGWGCEGVKYLGGQQRGHSRWQTIVTSLAPCRRPSVKGGFQTTLPVLFF